MKFEEVLPLMRGGMIGIDPFGCEWKMGPADILRYRCKNGAWIPSPVSTSGEWTIKKEPKKIKVWDWLVVTTIGTYLANPALGLTESEIVNVVRALGQRSYRKICDSEREVEVSE